MKRPNKKDYLDRYNTINKPVFKPGLGDYLKNI